MFPDIQLKYFYSPDAEKPIISPWCLRYTFTAVKICNCLSFILITNLHVFILPKFFLYAGFSIPNDIFMVFAELLRV